MMQPTSPIPHCAEENLAPVGVRLAAGSHIQVGDRELTPLIGVSVYRRRRAFVGIGREGACARGVVHLRPVGVVDRSGDHEHAVPIRDATAWILSTLTIAGLLIPVALMLLARLTRRPRRTAAANRSPAHREA
jgi:hypothetical protein